MIPLMLICALSTACRSTKGVEITDDTANCTLKTWYRDSDGDGHGNPDFSAKECEAPAGYVKDGDDCDDENDKRWNTCPGLDCVPLSLGIPTSKALPDTGEDTGEQEEEIDSKYWYCPSPENWQAARQICANAFQGDLHAAGSRIEWSATTLGVAQADLSTGSGLWLGLYQQSTTPTVDFGWFWVNEEGPAENDTLDIGGIWHPMEPDNGGWEENHGGDYEEDVAALIYRGGNWGAADMDSLVEFPFLCEAYVE
jgi:hypothetical protein